MRLLLIVFINCAVSDGHFYADIDLPSIDWENWLQLRTPDITQCSMGDVGKSLSYICLKVVPKPNVANDPRNKFVDALSLNAKLSYILLDELKVDFNITGESEYFDTLISTFVEQFSPYLEQALQERLSLLGELEKTREHHEVQTVLSTVKPILRHVLPEGLDWRATIPHILSQIKGSILSDELKKILSYPVVKEELIRVLSSNSSHEDESIVNQFVDVLLPFIHEGIHKEDVNLVNLYTSESAEGELLNLLVPQYKYLIRNGLLKAKNLDMVLDNSYNNNDTISRDIEEELSVYFRQAISIFERYPGETNIFPENCDKPFVIELVKNIMKNNLNRRMEQIDVKHILYKKLNGQMGTEKNPLVFDDHPTILNIWLSLHGRCKQRILRECTSYFKIHSAFTKQNESALIEFVRNSLMIKYKDIVESDINILKSQITVPSDVKIEASDLKTTLDINIPQKLISFQNEIERRAINQYGFVSGMFTYSKSYFDLLEALFFSSVSTENDNSRYLDDKLEL